jgi:RNA polymerase sigma factor (sigma-70 family)
MARQAISLQTTIGTQDGNFSLEDTLKDENNSASDFTDFDKDVTYQMLYKLLKTLNSREQEIIILRFGLFGNKPTPFTELSERFNLTRERVRQLELKILNKLRAPDKLKLLDYNFSKPKK